MPEPAATTARARRLRRWLLHGVLGGTVAAGGALALRDTPGMREAELQSYDLRMRNSAPAAANRDIVIVAIDDRSMEALGPRLGQWPWPRFAYARALDFLRSARVKQVVFDLAFAEPDLVRQGSDAELADAIAQAGNVVLPIALHAGDADRERRAREAEGDTSTAYLPRFAVPSAPGSLALPELARVTAVPLPAFGGPALALGSMNLFSDPEDGATRRADLLYRHDGRLYPALAVAAARIANPARFGGAVKVERDRLTIGSVAVPLTDGRMLIRWRGPFLEGKRETYRVIPFSLVTNSYEQVARGDAPDVDPASLAGKTVFVATTAAGLLDLRVTPFGQAPGVLMHAAMLDDLLQYGWIVRAPRAANVAFVVAVALLAGAAVTLLGSALAEALAAAAVLLASLAAAHLAFRAGIWLDLVAPLTGGALAAVGGMVANYMTEGRDKRRVREMFSRYVSPEYVRQLADEHRGLRLGGQRIPLTLLFSDIRGFTTISETYPPEVVVEVLNEYLARMSEVVFRHGGTLDKFIGDAVMAFWGAPLPVADHARRAAETALDMVDELERLNARWEAEGRPIRIDIGIGINTGEAIVGNIGSLGHKLDYTAIGDTVNLASRLEGLNKQYGTRVIVSEATRQALGNAYESRPLDEVRVKGKEQAVQIHELTGRRAAAPPRAVPAAALAALAGLLLAAAPLHAQKARWTDQVYQPGRWQAGRLAPLTTSNAATDTLALVAQVETYSQPPRWRAEIRKVEGGRVGEPLVLLADGANVSVLTGVSATALRDHRAAADPIAQAVAARFDVRGQPKDRGPARLVDRAADRHVLRVTLRRPATSTAFPDALLASSRTRRTFGNLMTATAQQLGSNRSQEVVATAGSRALSTESKVSTPEGQLTIRNDTMAVIAMEHRPVDVLALDDFIRAGRLGTAMPVKEEQIP
ncbi:MAG: cyaA [Gemmatimonadetes bacterium]|nr:cyaA [Gemmatimonadota bacterium]